MADEVKMQRIAGHSEERFLGSDVFESSGRSLPPPLKGGTVREDAREIGRASCRERVLFAV